VPTSTAAGAVPAATPSCRCDAPAQPAASGASTSTTVPTVKPTVRDAPLNGGASPVCDTAGLPIPAAATTAATATASSAEPPRAAAGVDLPTAVPVPPATPTAATGPAASPALPISTAITPKREKAYLALRDTVDFVKDTLPTGFEAAVRQCKTLQQFITAVYGTAQERTQQLADESMGKEQPFTEQQHLAAVTAAKTLAVQEALSNCGGDEQLLSGALTSIDSLYAAAHGLTKLTQRWDGNCWARVIAFMMFGDAAHHDWVRARILLKLRELLRQELMHCLDVGFDKGAAHCTLHYTAVTESKCRTVAEYLHMLEQAATWGGQLELQAVQPAFKIPVALWVKSKSGVNATLQGTLTTSAAMTALPCACSSVVTVTTIHFWWDNSPAPLRLPLT
jgi:OTU-like cysteine protease